LPGHEREAIDAAMRAIGHGILGVIVAATTATAAFAQQNPGLSVQPSGRSLADPTATPMEKPVDLLRPNPVQSTNETSFAADPLYAPEFEDKPWAQALLGSKYVRSSQSKEQFTKGLELLNTAAQQGEPTAQYELATLYAEGRGVPRDPHAALLWAGKAADQGNREAQFSAGRVLIESENPTSKAKGLDYLTKAAEAGHSTAVLFLATAVGNGRFGLTKDEARAETFLKPLAEKGNADCQIALASLYKFGDSFAARRDEAQVWLQRAADQGQPKALEILSSEEMQRPAELSKP
jgi:TPR repeat protein